MIDSHCHLDHAPLLENLKNVIGRAKSVGVNQFLTISTSIKSFENVKKIISHYKEVFGTVGIHPHETELHKDISKNSLIKLKLNHDKIIGIGETGLDFYYENSDKIIQKKIFIEHIEASLELNLPLIIHSRSAEEDTFNILNDYF
jgi:TatD DNase family protein